MISKEDEDRILEFSSIYRKKAIKVVEYRDELEKLQNIISKELAEMETMRDKELSFLDELRDRYQTTPDEIIQLIQKIIMANG